MKLAICIPAYNEAQNIAAVIHAVPRHIHGFREIKIFVMDDGSSDETLEIARRLGAVVEAGTHRGLAQTFALGIKKALQWGADVIVNIDADGQYDPQEIPDLVEPLLQGDFDMVVGDRQVEKLEFMAPAKKYGNMVGSWFLRRLTGSRVKDASSGFRAYNRKAAESIKIESTHTYTHENLIQAHYEGLKIAQIPVTFSARGDNGGSRLIRSVLKHIFKSLQGILRAWATWRRNKG